MWIKGIKKIPYSYKIVILGLVFVLLMLVLFCGYIQSANHSAGGEGAICSRSLLLANYISVKNSSLLLSVLFFSFVVLALLIKSIINLRQGFDAPFRQSITFLKIAQSIPKLYNPILKALRRGILHSQIYNFALISS